MRVRLALSVLPVLMFACDGEDTASTDTEDDSVTDTDSETEDTDSETDTDDPAAFQPTHIGVRYANTGIDADGLAVPFTVDDVTTDPWIGVQIWDDAAVSAEGFTEANSCIVYLSATSIPVTSWSADTGVHWGFILPAGSVVQDDCSELDFPAAWGGDVGAVIDQWSWGVGISDMTDQMQATLDADSTWDLDAQATGGGWYSNLLSEIGAVESGYLDGGYTLAYAADDTMTVDMSTPLLTAEANAQEPGLYTIQPRFSFDGLLPYVLAGPE